MKSEKLQDAIGLVGDDLIAEAKKTRNPHRTYLAAAIAAILVLTLSLNLLFGITYQPPPDSTLATAPTPHEDAVTMNPISLSDLGLTNLVAAPTFPLTVQFSPENFDDYKANRNHLI